MRITEQDKRTFKKVVDFMQRMDQNGVYLYHSGRFGIYQPERIDCGNTGNFQTVEKRYKQRT